MTEFWHKTQTLDLFWTLDSSSFPGINGRQNQASENDGLNERSGERRARVPAAHRDPAAEEQQAVGALRRQRVAQAGERPELGQLQGQGPGAPGKEGGRVAVIILVEPAIYINHSCSANISRLFAMDAPDS